MLLTKSNQNIEFAHKKGYKVSNGVVTSFTGKVLVLNNRKGVDYFSMRTDNSNSDSVSVTRLAAYQKFGNDIFKEGMCVFHQNGDVMDNLCENIVIGTMHQVMMARPAEARLAQAKHASSFAQKHDHTKILEMYNNGMSYNKIMKETGIKSKGTISFICKKSNSSNN